MNMIGHENPGMHSDPKFGGTLFKPVGLGGNILVRSEYCLPVITALNDVNGNPAWTESTTPRHKNNLTG